MKLYVILSIICISLLSVHYSNVRRAVLTGAHPEYKIEAFTSINSKGMMPKYKENSNKVWEGRVVSSFIGNKFCKINGLLSVKTKNDFYKFAHIAALYGVLWLSLTFLVIIIISKNKLLFILGMFSALQFSFTFTGGLMFQPWDGPELFFWTLILLINTTKYRKNILWMIPLAAMFKETTILLTVLILFWDDAALKSRIKLFVVIGTVCMANKLILNLVSGADCGILTMPTHYDFRCRSGHYWLIHRNIWSLYQFGWGYVLYAASGLAISLFILKRCVEYKIIAALYFMFIMVFCVLSEARLFNVYIPLFFVSLEMRSIKNDNNTYMCNGV